MRQSTDGHPLLSGGKPFSCADEKGRGCEMCLCRSKQKRKEKNPQTNKQTGERRQRAAFDKYKRNERLIHRRMQAIILISSRSQHKKRIETHSKTQNLFGHLSPSTCLPVLIQSIEKFYTHTHTNRTLVNRTANQELVID